MYKYAMYMYVSHVHINSREGWVTLGPGRESDWLSRDAHMVVYGRRRETTTEPAGHKGTCNSHVTMTDAVFLPVLVSKGKGVW